MSVGTLDDGDKTLLFRVSLFVVFAVLVFILFWTGSFYHWHNANPEVLSETWLALVGLGALVLALASGRNKTGNHLHKTGVSLDGPELSRFGRIPLDTFRLFSAHVRDVAGPVLAYLPLTITKEMRDWTVKKTLEYVYCDWRENGSAEILSSADKSDLGSFAELAYHVCRNGRTDEISSIDEAVYKTVLEALLRDWLQNWNAEPDSSKSG